MSLRLVISGGGTGGHIYPALAIVRAVQEVCPEVRVLYIGTAAGLEASIVPKEGLPFEAIPAKGLIRKGVAGAPGAALTAARGTAAALRIIRRFGPDVVVGTGGYVSGPVALAARLARVPLVLHEQNVFPGVTNRIAACWAAAVAVPHEAAAAHFGRRVRVTVTGNPVRRAVLETSREEGLRVLELPQGARVIYIVGGSQGARALNQAAVTALPGWLALPGVWVVFATGRRYYEEMEASLSGTERASQGTAEGRLVLLPYLDRPDAALAVADAVVTRGGAMSLAEIASRGVPAVIVPSPNVAHNEQEFNARVFERAGAARVILEPELDGPVLEKAVTEILSDTGLRERMRRASVGLARPQAADELARLVLAASRRRAP